MRFRTRMRTSALLQQRARELRRQMTPAEQLLWAHLKGRQLRGLKFRRQHPLGPFIPDFYCAQAGLVVEVDGDVHEGQKGQDADRTAELGARGYRVLRFPNEQVLNRLEDVLEAIGRACGEGGPHSPPPAPAGPPPPPSPRFPPRLRAGSGRGRERGEGAGGEG